MLSPKDSGSREVSVSKLSFIVGGAIGFVLGARAGRPTYERIRYFALAVVTSGPVQAVSRKADQTVGEFVRGEATKMTDSVADAVKDKINTLGKPKTDAAAEQAPPH